MYPSWSRRWVRVGGLEGVASVGSVDGGHWDGGCYPNWDYAAVVVLVMAAAVACGRAHGSGIAFRPAEASGCRVDHPVTATIAPVPRIPTRVSAKASRTSVPTRTRIDSGPPAVAPGANVAPGARVDSRIAAVVGRTDAARTRVSSGADVASGTRIAARIAAGAGVDTAALVAA